MELDGPKCAFHPDMSGGEVTKDDVGSLHSVLTD